MSEEPKIDDKMPVTLGMFQAVLKQIQDSFNDALSKRDQQIESRFNQFASVLQQVADKVQPAAQPSTALASLDKGELLGKAIDKIADKFLNTDQPTELQSISELLAKAMIREVVLSGKKRARVALNRGYLSEEETEGILDDNVEKAIVRSHGPI